MAYKRATKDVFEVQGFYNGWECVTAADTRKEAFCYLKDYRLNEPSTEFRIKTVRERIEQ